MVSVIERLLKIYICLCVQRVLLLESGQNMIQLEIFKGVTVHINETRLLNDIITRIVKKQPFSSQRNIQNDQKNAGTERYN